VLKCSCVTIRMDWTLYTHAASDLRVVQELLWDVIATCLPSPAERDEVRSPMQAHASPSMCHASTDTRVRAQVKRAIGWGRVEDNEGLFAEASALAEILGDVQLSTQQVLDRQKLFANPQRRLVRAHACSARAPDARAARAVPPSPPPQRAAALTRAMQAAPLSQLAAPPPQRAAPLSRAPMQHRCAPPASFPHAQVEGEVRMLMERLVAVAAAAPFAGSGVSGRDPGAVVPRGTAKGKAVFEYVDRVAGGSAVRPAGACWGLLTCSLLLNLQPPAPPATAGAC
jgi:hypothetical protein